MTEKHCSRRNFMKASVLGVAFGPGVLATGNKIAANVNNTPNIIFILTDDQRYDAVGCYPGSTVQTPNIDRLAQKGTIFNNAFVVLSICAPSRAACMTGRYGSKNGVMNLRDKLKSSEKTFAHYLKDAGYNTALIGKTHCSRSPEDLGFDYVVHFESNGPHINRKVLEQGVEKTAEGYIEEYLSGKAADFLQKQRGNDNPYILFYCTQVPHMNSLFTWPASEESLSKYPLSEMPVPKSWDDTMEGKPPYLKNNRNRQRGKLYGYDKPDEIQSHYQKYYAAITDMDKALGRLVDEIEKNPNTYVFFMGDNGWFLGEHCFTSKVLPYEESMHVPMFAYGPGVKRQRLDGIALNIDIAPTILQMAGVDVPGNMDGMGLIDILKGKSKLKRNSFFYEAPKSELGSWPLYAIRGHRYKYIRTYFNDQPDKMCFEELYDIQNDSVELKNLIGQAEFEEILKTMRSEMDRQIEISKKGLV